MDNVGIASLARHEAAHAVLSVRLELPLESTDIRRRPVESTEGRGVPDNVEVVSGGYTTLVPDTAEGWESKAKDGDATARANLEALAVQTAGGIVAAGRYDAPACRDDLAQLVITARALGIGTSNKQPAVEAWIKRAVQQATDLLYRDDGAAWDRVRVALMRKKRLLGDEVTQLVRESDKRRA